MTHSRSGLVPYPPEVAAHYRELGYWRDETIPAAFRTAAAVNSTRPAVVTSHRRQSFAQLDERSDQLAAGLLGLGLRPGDAVTLQVENSVTTVELWYGLLKAGMVPVCTLPRHRHHEIDEIARVTGARAHVAQHTVRGLDAARFSRELRDRVPTIAHLLLTEAPEAFPDTVRVEDLGTDITPGTARSAVDEVTGSLAPDDIAVFQLSGGTTARPKVIPRLHAEYLYNVRARIERWQVTSDDVMGYVLPLVHNAGVQTSLHLAHLLGIPLVLSEPMPDEFLSLFAREGVTRTLLPSGFASTLVDHPEFEGMARRLRALALTLGKVSPTLFDRLTDLGPTVIQEFGMGEGLVMTHSLDDPEEARRTTVGTPISPADEVRLLDAEGNEVPSGERGELHVRGPYTIRGYLHAPERNAVAFSVDGFYNTGDVMVAREIDGRTFFQVEDRTKDFINRGGEKINAAEVEMLLLEHPRIREAAVVAMPDDRLGERACAFIISDNDLSLEEVQHHFDVLDVAKFKWPERVEVVDALPRTAVGKTVKSELRDRARTLTAQSHDHQGA